MNLTYRSPKTEVRSSPIHGKGLFAKAAIAAGEIVAVKGGYIYTETDWRLAEAALGPAEIQIESDLFIAPSSQAERDGDMVYSNHSCDPNVALQGQIAFVAMRDISSGEELTHDWATTDDGDYQMPCRCGSPACRKIISGRDWMKPELQVKYAGWFCWHLQRKIDSQKGLHEPAQGTRGKVLLPGLNLAPGAPDRYRPAATHPENLAPS